MPVYQLYLKGHRSASNLIKRVDAPSHQAMTNFLEARALQSILENPPEVIPDTQEIDIMLDETGKPFSRKEDDEVNYWASESLQIINPPQNTYSLSYTDDDYLIQLNGGLFDPTPSLNVVRHSPDGFSYGYGGSGPAQLALGILLNETGSKLIATRWYQDFKNKIIANVPKCPVTPFQITSDDVRVYLDLRNTNVSEETINTWAKSILSR